MRTILFTLFTIAIVTGIFSDHAGAVGDIFTLKNYADSRCLGQVLNEPAKVKTIACTNARAQLLYFEFQSCNYISTGWSYALDTCSGRLRSRETKDCIVTDTMTTAGALPCKDSPENMGPKFQWTCKLGGACWSQKWGKGIILTNVPNPDPTKGKIIMSSDTASKPTNRWYFQ